nr:hypothetical protein [Tanacetum cinerariifolium]
MSPKNKAHFKSEKEAIHLLLTGIGDKINSTVDACKTAHEMWIAIEMLQQGLWQLSSNNPLALVAAASPYPDPYYQAPKSHKSFAPPSKQSSSTRSNASIKLKGKEIAKLITPPSELVSKEDSDHEQAQRDKDMQKNLALIAKYFKKIYKPTNNNLRTSSNSKNKNVDTTPSDHEQAQRDKDMQKNLALIAKYFKKIYKPTNNNLRTSSNSKNKNVDTTPRYKNENQIEQFESEDSDSCWG